MLALPGRPPRPQRHRIVRPDVCAVLHSKASGDETYTYRCGTPAWPYPAFLQLTALPHDQTLPYSTHHGKCAAEHAQNVPERPFKFPLGPKWHLNGEAGAAGGVDHGAHGGQVAAREDVLADEVAGCAVCLIALIWLADGLCTRNTLDQFLPWWDLLCAERARTRSVSARVLPIAWNESREVCPFGELPMGLPCAFCCVA